MPLTPEKLEQKKQQLTERTAKVLGVSANAAIEYLSIPRSQSVRINTLKADKEKLMSEIALSTASTSEVSWFEHGIFIKEGIDLIRDCDAAQDGRLYIQNAASWLPVLALDPQPGEHILDVCAAPGGKTSHIAQHSGNQAFITANDNSRPRLLRMQHNLERLGVQNVTYSLHDATRLTKYLEIESFDKILLDAPCSGEGMMTLNDNKSFESWSVAHIKRLQQLQKRLVVQAWQLLKPGGTLVYSTCTMAPEENEAVIDYLLRHNGEASVCELNSLKSLLPNATTPVLSWNEKQYNEELNKAIRLKPSKEIEAFFVVKLGKAA